MYLPFLNNYFFKIERLDSNDNVLSSTIYNRSASNDRSKYDIVEIFYDDTYNDQITNFKIKNNWTYDYCV